jgi:hypothetical protein
MFPTTTENLRSVPFCQGRVERDDPRNSNNINRPSDFPASPATREGTIGFMPIML